jgi:uncharacterized protein
VEFEWDHAKEIENLRKHKVSFTEAATVCGDWLAATVSDPDHSIEEQRFLTVGFSRRQRVLIVSYTERQGWVRITNARELTRSETRAYEITRQKDN